MTMALANAPVSYGVFELTVGTDRYLAPVDRVLDEVAAAGYVGIDLGPMGYLGTGAQLARRLAERGLSLAGGYLELPFAEPDTLSEHWPALDALLDAFDAVPRHGAAPAPRPTLAAAVSEAHIQQPGRAQADRSIGLDDAAWQRFGAGLNRVASHCRSRGYEPTLHHHTGTYVEAPWEIERALDLTDVGLCLDTGHLLVGTGDPVSALTKWATRVNHVHLKDAQLSVLAEIVARGGAADQIWSRGVFCPLGEGDLDIAGFLAVLRAIEYDGWIVVEQDVIVQDRADFELTVADQRANRRLLDGLGF